MRGALEPYPSELLAPRGKEFTGEPAERLKRRRFISDAARQRGPLLTREAGGPQPSQRSSAYLSVLSVEGGWCGEVESGPAHWGSLSPLRGMLCGVFSLMLGVHTWGERAGVAV